VSSVPSREATTSIPRLPVSVSTIATRYQPSSEHPPLRLDRSQTGTTSERSSVNDAAGANASVGIPGSHCAFYLLTSEQSKNTDTERIRKEPLLEERDIDRRSKELESEPQRLIRSTSAIAENSSIHHRGGGHNQPMGAWETVGTRQKASRSHMPPVGPESLQRGLTRSPSPMTPQSPPYPGSTGPPQENLRTAKPRGWIRRLSMPVLSSLDSSKKTDSPWHNDSSRAWRTSLALPETKSRYRKTSLDTLSSRSNQRR